MRPEPCGSMTAALGISTMSEDWSIVTGGAMVNGAVPPGGGVFTAGP